MERRRGGQAERMSEPIRYSEVSNDWNGEAAGLAPSADGEWVKYEDYARLHSQFANSEQENARLKEEVEYWKKGCER